MAAESQPPWITREFLEKILQKECRDPDVSVTKYDISTATPKGGGYLSTLYRVVVEYTRNNGHPVKLSLVIKSQPEDIYQLDFSKKVRAFIKEETMYQKILPAMKILALRMKSNIPLMTFAPKYFECPKQDTLVLEDLKESGFKLVDRRKRLDFDHSLLVVRKLAEFHATSIALHHEDGSYMESFSEGHYTQIMYDGVKSFFNQTFDALICNLEKWGGFERSISKLEKLSEKATDIMMEQIRPRDGGIVVLNHGDVWVNNLMFKYSRDGQVEDVRFFDFQLARFTSPAIELHFFFCLSIQEEVLFHKFYDLIEEYYLVLSEKLECYKCDPNLVSLLKLKKEMKNTAEFAVITTCSKLWFVLVNPDHVDDVVFLDKFSRGEGTFNPLVKVYSDPLIRKTFENLLPYFEKRGYL
jgi:Domain of unknown function (DUF227).